MRISPLRKRNRNRKDQKLNKEINDKVEDIPNMGVSSTFCVNKEKNKQGSGRKYLHLSPLVWRKQVYHNILDMPKKQRKIHEKILIFAPVRGIMVTRW